MSNANNVLAHHNAGGLPARMQNGVRPMME